MKHWADPPRTVSIEDPLRLEVAPAIKNCHRAGIDVRMVTGDDLTTAIAMTKGAGILDTQLYCNAGVAVGHMREDDLNPLWPGQGFNRRHT